MSGELSVSERVPLAPKSTLGVGGCARWFAEAATPADVAAAQAWCRDRGLDLFLLGGGSNVVIADAGFDGLVLRIAIRGLDFSDTPDGSVVTAGAGEVWDDVVAAAVRRGLAGIECLSGIPGLVGATPIQNVGAYGQDVGQTIQSVTTLDRITGAVGDIPVADCGFAYRMSRFKGADAGRFVVTRVSFRLRRGAATATYPDVRTYLADHRVSEPTVAQLRDAVLAIRRRKGMVLDEADPDTRSVGSFFMNPVVTSADHERIGSVAGTRPPSFPVDADHVKVPAAWLIERAGFRKGDGDGAVGISTRHPLAIVNRGAATARDVLRMATRIKKGVADRFAVLLRPEPIFVGFGDDPEVTYLLM
jgi:UDP-N-acetylmuramate dehydrogenase